MPQLIPDDDTAGFDMKLTTSASNKIETNVFLKNGPSAFAVPGYVVPHGYRLLIGAEKPAAEGMEQTICLVADGQEPETVYKVKMLVRNAPNAYLASKNCTQLIVWRTFDPRHRAVVTGFPRTIFNHLLDSHDIMITDEQQTSDGKRFWMERIADAISVPEQFVYYIDLDNLDDSLVPKIESIDTYDEFVDSYVSVGWGNDDNYRSRVFMISKRDLSQLIKM
ncbi:hypothetical protein KCG43_19105 [Photobacterium sp. WH24]|uniref:hypothetical protein n=1 Tax=Photobacterium sp. WH24 TaxID=2827237 RepID=UPI001C464848|nr:hypothetical protein [Photobacterium sp. WH24]MBV7264124.1 hypothetical protein [Photobacterium sp. WH24]